MQRAENPTIFGLKKKKMLQKKTTYHQQLDTAPAQVKLKMASRMTPEINQGAAYLVFLDMLQLLKM